MICGAASKCIFYADMSLVSSEIAKPTKFNSKRQDAVNEPFKLMNKTDTLKTISRVRRFISQLILFIDTFYCFQRKYSEFKFPLNHQITKK